MVSIHHILYACLEYRFPDVASFFWRPVSGACKILCSNVLGHSRNLSDLTVASSQYDSLLCSETLVLDRRQISEFLVPEFGRPVLLGRDGMPGAHGIAAYARDGHFANRNLSLVVARC